MNQKEERMGAAYYMQLALGEARSALEEGEVPVGAVLVRDGRVICSAHNRREQDKDPSAHAELLCMRKGAGLLGDWRLTDCELYVTLEPCPMCAGAMVMSRLKKCVYGAADPRYGCCGSVYDLPGDPALQGRTIWQEGLLEEECRGVLQEMFAGRRSE